jgi:hypothetical protein
MSSVMKMSEALPLFYGVTDLALFRVFLAGQGCKRFFGGALEHQVVDNKFPPALANTLL